MATFAKTCSCGGACNHLQEQTDNVVDMDLSEDSSEELMKEDIDSSFDEDRRDNYLPESTPPSKTAMQEKTRKAQKRGRVKKSAMKMSLSHIEKSLEGFQCCSRDCAHRILNKADILNARIEFLDMDREDQARWLLNFFHLCLKSRGAKDVYDYRVEGKILCQKAWVFSYGISYGRFHYWRNEYQRGIRDPIHRGTGILKKSERFMEAELWFQEYSSAMGNRMPDSTRVELPACQTVRKVYRTYVEAVKNPLKSSQFRTMWLETYSEVVIPKRNRFSKCGVCLLIGDHIRETKNQEKKMTWLEKKQRHLDQQAAERRKYYKHQKKAGQRPDKYLSIIIDGMDQAKTGIPHFVQSSKIEGENDHFMKTHVTGILSHGLNLSMCFIDFLRWPQDANATVNFLTSCFRHILKTKRRLPPTLYLQLDNCYRDCKNVYILGFCSLLVKAKVFKKVRLSYLMVGHTHEDIDQMFSRISVALNKNKAVTRPQLQKVIQEAFTPSPITIFVENIYDIKSWIRPYIATFRNHSHPHAFRFKLNEQGEVEMTYRNWANSGTKEWLPNPPHVSLRTLPSGNPPVLKPDLAKCPTVEKMKDAIGKTQPRMTSEELEWWNKTIDAESKKIENWNRLSDQQYQDAGQSFDLLSFRCQPPDPDPEAADPEYEKRQQELQRLLDKKSKFKPVEIVKKAK